VIYSPNYGRHAEQQQSGLGLIAVVLTSDCLHRSRLIALGSPRREEEDARLAHALAAASSTAAPSPRLSPAGGAAGAGGEDEALAKKMAEEERAAAEASKKSGTARGPRVRAHQRERRS